MITRHMPSPRRLGAALVLLAPRLGLLSGYAQRGPPKDLDESPVHGCPGDAAEGYHGKGDLELAPPAADVDGLHAVPISFTQTAKLAPSRASSRVACSVLTRRGCSPDAPPRILSQPSSSPR